MKAIKHGIVPVLFGVILTALAGCDVSVNINTDKGAPEAVDYSDESNWAYFGIGEDKDVDLFLLCPAVDVNDEYNTSLDDEATRQNFLGALNMERGIYEEHTRMYAPYYRQAALKAYSLSPDEREQYLQFAYNDVSSAFSYYLENENNGRPIVLAGFSQGADMCYRLLEEYFGDEELSSRLVAVYAIGWPYTQDMVDKFPQIKPARSADDIGTVISFECESEDANGSLICPEDMKALSINPLNWKTDTTPADKSLNIGACFTDYSGQVLVEEKNLCGCYIDKDRGTLKVTDILPEDYPPALDFLSEGDYHIYDYQFFYRNLAQNVKNRIDIYMDHEMMPADMEALKWWQDTIAYEIYVRSFKDSDGDGYGDLKGITSELDHLQNLGVGAIWLTPCYASPQADNGYDIADYYNIDPTYGTMEDMDELIAEAKKRNIRIVMDLVFNHTSNQNAWFTESASGKDNDKSDWYIWADPKEDGSAPTNWRGIFGGSAWEYNEQRGQYYLHTFLKEQPDLNWENPEVRKALRDVANFWVDKGVGGFRMDAISYIKKPAEFVDGTPDADDGMVGIHTMTANTDGILDYLNEFKDAVQVDNDIFTVGEAHGVSAQDLPKWVGKSGVFDMVFEFGFIDIELPDENNWCDRRSWTLPEFKACFTASEETTSSPDISGWYPMYLENHDQPRSIDHFLPDDADRVAGGKALGTLLLTMRGTPFIMQGEELGYTNVSWPSIDDYNDVSTKNHYYYAIEEGYSEQEALDAVHRYSRDNSRTPMQWNASENAGFTTGKPWLPVHDDYAVVNVESEMSDPGSVLNWYIALKDLRDTHHELVDGNYTELLSDDESIFAYVRENDDAKAIILINFTTSPASYDASIVEDADLILGSNEDNTKGTLAPLEAAIYEEVKK